MENITPIPPQVAKLIPPAQLTHVNHYLGVYTEALDRLNKTISTMPRLGETVNEPEPPPYLHYHSGTASYHICEYDGDDTMYGKVHFNYHHNDETAYRKFSLSNLKSNEFIELDFFGVTTH